MVMLTIAISGGPFLGLLGTVIGVMITFAAIAAAGDVNVNAIAPGIAAALAATVAGLAVAIPVWLILVIGVVGIAFALAALQVFVRDVEHVLMPILMILMYLTPILYPLSLVPANLRGVVAANPFGWIVARLREALLEGQLAVHASDAIALVVALLLFAGGRWVFRRLSPHFEDFV